LLEFDMRVIGTNCPVDFAAVGVGSPQLLQLSCSNSLLSLTEQAFGPQGPSIYQYSLGTTLTEGVWHHFRLSEMGSELGILIDGTEVFRSGMHSMPTADARLLSLAGSTDSVSAGYDNVVLSCP
jgi:hypothetical protein